MIAKAEVLQRLKKMGMTVADDASIVTVLLPQGVSFETGLKDVRQKLTELGYEASFCVKQSKDASISKEESQTTSEEEAFDEPSAKISEEEMRSYLSVDSEGDFTLDDDGQFTLGLDF